MAVVSEAVLAATEAARETESEMVAVSVAVLEKTIAPRESDSVPFGIESVAVTV